MSAIAAASPRTHQIQFPHSHATPAACRCQDMPPPDREFQPTIEGLAQAMRDQFPDCTEASLQAEGFSVAFQHRYGDQARVLANAGFVRQVEPATATYDRAARVEKAANAAAGLVTHEAIATHLLGAGFRSRELGDIMPDVIDRLCQIVVGRDLEPARVQ